VTSASAARLRAAREHLVHLVSRLGRGGISAARSRPGLLAAPDDRAAEHSWTAPSADEIDWSFAEWPVLRLLAVCALARESGVA
jgi:hypothetical protein